MPIGTLVGPAFGDAEGETITNVVGIALGAIVLRGS